MNIGSDSILKLTGSVNLPEVRGRIDHMAFDPKRDYIYVAALGNNTIEVVDMKAGKVINTIRGLGEPQGIRYIEGKDAIFVANGSDGECDVYDAASGRKISSVKLEGDADNVRYDSENSRIYTGYGDGGIAIFDASTFNMLGDIKLPGHPESFQIDVKSKRIYVNVPNIQMILTINTDTRSIIDKWKVRAASANFPMSLDQKNHRLFIGCRNPAKLLVIDTDLGETISSVDIDSDTDDVFYDNASKQVYVSCGGGYIDIIRQSGPDNYSLVSRIESQPGARTSLYIPELNHLVVAAPARQGHSAQLLIYSKGRKP